jgi:peptidyl-prolyl cis-trans isomerase SurA
MRSYFFRFCLLLFAMLPLGLSAEVVDRIVAIVNDDIITLQEVEKHVRVETETRITSVKEYFRKQKLAERIDNFIDDTLIRQQARKLRIDVGKREVDHIIDNIKKQYLVSESEMKAQLTREGVSYNDFVEGIRMNVLRSRVISRVISPDVLVTDKALKEYYDKHVEDFREEEFRLQQIFISGKRNDVQQRALAASEALKSGAPFESVAKDFSDDPSGPQGGDIGYVNKAELFPELRQALVPLVPGMFTGLVRTPYGFMILKLLDVRKGDVVPFDAVKEKIHAKLVQEESEKRYKDFIDKLRKSSYIEVKV